EVDVDGPGAEVVRPVHVGVARHHAVDHGDDAASTGPGDAAAALPGVRQAPCVAGDGAVLHQQGAGGVHREQAAARGGRGVVGVGVVADDPGAGGETGGGGGARRPEEVDAAAARVRGGAGRAVAGDGAVLHQQRAAAEEVDAAAVLAGRVTRKGAVAQVKEAAAVDANGAAVVGPRRLVAGEHH